MSIGSGSNSPFSLSRVDGTPGTRYKKSREKKKHAKVSRDSCKKQKLSSRYSVWLVSVNLAWMERLDKIVEPPM